jgi:BirA family transcriptional regulator, biotin operon repressor / biotin---[acetyl-CoA-carboxylase] ligase
LQLPFAGNQIGIPFIELQSVDSTNKYAMTLLKEAFLTDRQMVVKHGLVIFATEQTGGKGQMSKKWHSEKGMNITMSLIINPYPITLTEQFKLSICAALSVHEFFSLFAGDETKIKWPNDLYWRDRKAGGILIENMVQTTGNWQWAIIGIGLNINQTVFHSDLPNPVSLKQITGKDLEPVELAKDLCKIFENYFQLMVTGNFEKLFKQYQSILFKKDEKVKLKKGSRVFETTIKGVTQEGQLITQHSIEERFEFGEIEWLI